MAFGIYLHFPYCLSKCPYCDFASVVEPRIPHREYARALAWELELRLAGTPVRRAGSLYLGGGTPSLWDPEAAAGALGAVRAAVGLEPGAEVTLEANPGAAEVARLRAFRQAGFDRVSIGAQSFCDETLRALGRVHSGAEAEQAVHAAGEAGFSRVAVDLIYGAPGQTVDRARADARRLTALGPEHVSAYALTLDHLAREVPLARAVREGRIQLPDDEAQWAMGRAVGEVLDGAGLRRYEISNWARPGGEARHNALYWTGGEYLGLGCGAHGFLYADPARPALGGRRWGNAAAPAAWLEAVKSGRLPEDSSEQLSAADLFAERVGMGLRMTSGLDLTRACEELEQDPRPVLRRAEDLVRLGLASLEGSHLRLTERGLDFHSEAAARMLG